MWKPETWVSNHMGTEYLFSQIDDQILLFEKILQPSNNQMAAPEKQLTGLSRIPIPCPACTLTSLRPSDWSWYQPLVREVFLECCTNSVEGRRACLERGPGACHSLEKKKSIWVLLQGGSSKTQSVTSQFVSLICWPTLPPPTEQKWTTPPTPNTEPGFRYWPVMSLESCHLQSIYWQGPEVKL